MRFLSLKVLQLDLSSNVVQTRDVNKGERKESILFPFLSNKGHLFPPDQTPKYTPCVPSHHFPSFPPTHSSGSYQYPHLPRELSLTIPAHSTLIFY